MGSEEGAEGREVWLAICSVGEHKVGSAPSSSKSGKDREGELTGTGQAHQHEVPSSSSTHGHKRLARELMPLQYLDLPPLLAIPAFHLDPILLLAPKHTKVDLPLDLGSTLGLHPCHRRQVVELERRAKVDGLDHHVFARRAVVWVRLNH